MAEQSKASGNYVERSHEVLHEEIEKYLKQHRAVHNLPEPNVENLNGICISGGGVRSATLGLGMLQTFIRAGVLKHFDYLSTVSGGGYIGSCLSSLLSKEPDKIDKALIPEIPNQNRRFDAADMGVEADDSPLVDLRDKYEYDSLENAKLSAKHQLHHLRRNGEYLTPNKKLLGWDVNRVMGTIIGGMLVQFVLFLLLVSTAVSLHHLLFGLISNGQFIEKLHNAGRAYTVPADASLQTMLGLWYHNKLLEQVSLIWNAVGCQWGLALIFGALGAIGGWAFLIYARQQPFRIAQMEQAEQRFQNPATDFYIDRPGGENMWQYLSRNYIHRFYLLAYVAGPTFAYLFYMIGQWSDGIPDAGYFAMLGLPLFFSLGLFLSVNILISLYFINHGEEKVSGRLYRSFYAGIQGASFLGVITSLLFPIAILLLFGKHKIAINFSVSFVPVATAYYVAMKGAGGKDGASSILGAIAKKLETPLLNLSIFLFVGLAFAWVSNLAYEIEGNVGGHAPMITGMLFLASLSLTIFLGFAANSNDISLHYFYRDRLSEAYLRTDGRVGRPDLPQDQTAVHVKSKDLFDINLRNHENLKLKDMGEGNFKGPYHIIVAAINLQGSNDLAKKTLKSDHFIFSKLFIGSRTTGYYRTAAYRGGSTKLSSAMAISAAAVSSGMGVLSFAASNFYITLLNLRTGYWLENPWYLHKEDREAELQSQGVKILRPFFERLTRRLKRFPFWLFYLWCEFTGSLDSKTRRVYVSDGGHTGDNLGLLPLIQRRCRNIVICDFEEDGKFTFGSFNQAVRLAKAVYGADIEIELDKLRPVASEDGLFYSKASVSTGSIRYSNGAIGRIVYMKSSVSLVEHAQSESAETGESVEAAPVFVLNYFRNNPSFPHHSTADQYFDEVQFEAYRMLGEHIGKQAVAELRV